ESAPSSRRCPRGLDSESAAAGAAVRCRGQARPVRIAGLHVRRGNPRLDGEGLPAAGGPALPMTHWRSTRRRAARTTVLVVALGWLVGLGMLVMRRDDGSHAARPHGPADGWSMIGLRHAGRDGGGGTVLLRAGELSLRRVQVGPFRLGFARELVARDVDIDVDVRPGDARRRLTPATAPRVARGGGERSGDLGGDRAPPRTRSG